MAAVHDPKTLGRARLAFSDLHDIDEFVATLEKFERREIGSDEWRGFRLLRGTYGQRQDATSTCWAKPKSRPQTTDGECAS